MENRGIKKKFRPEKVMKINTIFSYGKIMDCFFLLYPKKKKNQANVFI